MLPLPVCTPGPRSIRVPAYDGGTRATPRLSFGGRLKRTPAVGFNLRLRTGALEARTRLHLHLEGPCGRNSSCFSDRVPLYATQAFLQHGGGKARSIESLPAAFLSPASRCRFVVRAR